MVSFPCSFLLVDNITAAFSLSLSLSCRGADGLGPRFSPLRKARILLSPPRRGAQNLATYPMSSWALRTLWLPSGARFLRLVLATPRDRRARTAFAPITPRRTRRLLDRAPRSTRATTNIPFPLSSSSFAEKNSLVMTQWRFDLLTRTSLSRASRPLGNLRANKRASSAPRRRLF